MPRSLPRLTRAALLRSRSLQNSREFSRSDRAFLLKLKATAELMYVELIFLFFNFFQYIFRLFFEASLKRTRYKRHCKARSMRGVAKELENAAARILQLHLAAC